MQRTIDEKLRSPKEILAAMDKDGVKRDANLLSQLNSELSVSLAVEADRISKRNIWIGSIACIATVVALIISILQFRDPKVEERANLGYDSTYEDQLETYNRQSKMAADQLARTDTQLTKSEAQSVRFDALLTGWEAQLEQQNEIQDEVRDLLAERNSGLTEQTSELVEEDRAEEPPASGESKASE